MTHDYPIMLAPALSPLPAARTNAFAPERPVVVSPGSWRYPKLPGARWRVALALLISAAFHGVVFFGHRPGPAKVARVTEDHLIAMTIAMPELKDLEEPERVVRDDAEKVDLAEYAPTLMDAPQIALSTDFVQEINYASLVPKPDLDQAKVFVIPHNVARDGDLGAGLGNIFSLAELDQIPQAVVQPSPVYPMQLRREGLTARVVVEFIVDTEGRVRNAAAVESSSDQFNDAAVTGVVKWRFRPGVRGGRKVNTRMMVPIIFRITDVEG